MPDTETSNVYDELIETVNDLPDQIVKKLLVELIQTMPEEDQLVLLTDIKTRATKRVKTRHNVFTEIDFTVKNLLHKGLIQDISRSGLFIETDMPFTVGTPISMVIPFYKSDKKANTAGEVVRVVTNGIGVQFRKG
jgi:Tfp pilus assembly protein PilZ